MPDVTPYQLLFSTFADEARKGKDVQKAARVHLGALVHLWTTQLGTSGAARFRGFSLSPSSHKAEDGSEQVLLCVRGWDLQNSKVISFANGPNFELAAFSWLHSCATDGVRWKADEDKRQTSGVNGLLDAISSPSSKS